MLKEKNKEKLNLLILIHPYQMSIEKRVISYLRMLSLEMLSRSMKRLLREILKMLEIIPTYPHALLS